MYKTYEYRIYPNKEQEILLAKHFGCTRLVYNKALELQEALYKEGKKHLSTFDLCKELTKWKQSGKFSFLYEISNSALQQELIHLGKSYTKFFVNLKANGNKLKCKKKSIRRKERESEYQFTAKDIECYPRFKSKRSKQSYSLPETCYVEFEKSIIRIPKFQEGIKARLHRTFEGKIKTCTVKRSTTGKYFICVLVSENLKTPTKEAVIKDTTVGIDLGLENFATLSTGEVIENMKFLDNNLQRLRILSKRASKKVKGSNNQKKAYSRISVLHEKIRNRRADFLHKLTYKLTHDNQVSTVCIEDLNTKGMLQNKKLSRGISDVAWSEFTRQLEYKCEWYGKNLLKVNRFYPSSKTCHECGFIKEDLTLKERKWTCPQCGHEHNRDFNASLNIRDEALRQNLAGQGMPKELAESFS